MSQSLPIATTPAQITPQWLNRVFSEIGHDVDVGGVTTKSIGTGQSAHSERIAIEYARWDGTAPKSLVAKLPHPDPTSRATGHVHGSYARETNFYRLIAPTVKIHTPRCHYAAIDPANSDFVLLLEDLAPARQGDQMRGCSVAVAECAMREIAGLHGPRWGDPALLDHHFLAGASGQGSVGRELFEPFWAGFLARYRNRLTDELVRVGEGLLEHYDTYARTYPGARCATHGDYRLDNVLITQSDGGVRLTTVDWQTAGVGCGASDVAYFLGAGLLPDARRAHERELLRVYHDALAGHGVHDYPFDRLWRDYAWYSYAGYVMAVVASMLVVQTARGDEMFMTMASRHGQHIIDLEAQRLLAAS
jgi:hypothetical protein